MVSVCSKLVAVFLSTTDAPGRAAPRRIHHRALDDAGGGLRLSPETGGEKDDRGKTTRATRASAYGSSFCYRWDRERKICRYSSDSDTGVKPKEGRRPGRSVREAQERRRTRSAGTRTKRISPPGISIASGEPRALKRRHGVAVTDDEDDVARVLGLEKPGERQEIRLPLGVPGRVLLHRDLQGLCQRLRRVERADRVGRVDRGHAGLLEDGREPSARARPFCDSGTPGSLVSEAFSAWRTTKTARCAAAGRAARRDCRPARIWRSCRLTRENSTTRGASVASRFVIRPGVGPASGFRPRRSLFATRRPRGFNVGLDRGDIDSGRIQEPGRRLSFGRIGSEAIVVLWCRSLSQRLLREAVPPPGLHPD